MSQRKNKIQLLETASEMQILHQNDWPATGYSENNDDSNMQIFGKQTNNGSGVLSLNDKMHHNNTMLSHKNAVREYADLRGGFYKGRPHLTDFPKYPQSVQQEWPSSYFRFRCYAQLQQPEQLQQHQTYGSHGEYHGRQGLHNRHLYGHQQTATKEPVGHSQVEDTGFTETTDCFTSLVLTAMESTPSHHMTRDQICTWLLKNFQGFTEFPLYHMRNKITATLYLTGLFVKCCNKVTENHQYWSPIARYQS